MTDDEKLLEGERGASLMGAAIAFAISCALAVFSIVIAEDVALWIRAIFVVVACFFGWLLFFAPARVRVAVIGWFPWFPLF